MAEAIRTLSGEIAFGWPVESRLILESEGEDLIALTRDSEGLVSLYEVHLDEPELASARFHLADKGALLALRELIDRALGGS